MLSTMRKSFFDLPTDIRLKIYEINTQPKLERLKEDNNFNKLLVIEELYEVFEDLMIAHNLQYHDLHTIVHNTIFEEVAIDHRIKMYRVESVMCKTMDKLAKKFDFLTSDGIYTFSKLYVTHLNGIIREAFDYCEADRESDSN